MISKIIDFCLRNKLLVIVGAVLLAGWGVISFSKIPIEAFPDVTDTNVQIITKYPGKASEEVEKQITLPIEIELNGIPHAAQIRSQSLAGLSVINVIFDDEINIYLARQLVLERLSAVDFPFGSDVGLGPVSTPIGEVYRYTVESDTYSPMELRTIQDWNLRRELKKVSGVAEVTALGGLVKQYQILIDPLKLKSFGLTLENVFDAIASANKNTGGGYLKINNEQFSIRGIGLFSSVDDIKDIVIKAVNGVPVKVENIATVKIGHQVRLGVAGRDNNNDVVEGVVLMRRGENPSRVLKAVKNKLDEIRGKLPQGIKIVKTYNREELIKRTLENVGSTITLGVIFVFSVLMLFTGELTLAWIITLIVPLALLFAFILMRFAGVAANLLSLGAIDFGIIIDGSVVMAEAVFVILANHPDFKDNAPHIVKVGGAVGKPILFAKTIIILAFLPLFALQRVEGRLFEPLALTMTFAVLGALFFTLTLVPVLCSIFLKNNIVVKETWIVKKIEKIYLPILYKSINEPKKVIKIAVISTLLGFLLIPFLGIEFMPSVEEGGIWIRANMPVSVSIEEAHRIAPKIRKVIRSFPQVETVVSLTGRPEDATDPDLQNITEFLVDLIPKNKWGCSKEELDKKIEKVLVDRFPGIVFYFSQPIEDNVDEAIAGVKGQVAIKLFGPELNTLIHKANEVYNVVKDIKGVHDLFVDRIAGQPQLLIKIDRDLCAKYGVRVNNVQNIIETALGGKAATQFIEEEKRFDVTVRLLPEYRDNIEAIKNIQVASSDGNLNIPLSQLAKFVYSKGAPVIFRENMRRRAAVRFNVIDRDMGGLVAEAQKAVRKKIKLPEGYSIEWSGQFESQQRAMSRLAIIAPLSIFLIFILLFAEFGRIRNAVLILSTIPLAAIGGILGLFLAKIHLSVSAMVGFIALSGVSVQNGIILVSVINRLVKEGHNLNISIVNGVKERLKPVLMTSLLASIGLLPAALSMGTGSETQKPFAIVIVFGMISAVVLTLIVLPALYGWMERKYSKDKI